MASHKSAIEFSLSPRLTARNSKCPHRHTGLATGSSLGLLRGMPSATLTWNHGLLSSIQPGDGRGFFRRFPKDTIISGTRHAMLSMVAQPLFGWRTKFWSFLLKLAKDRPSWTIQAEPGPATGPFHWKSRLLSIEELCRLQTFPRGYEIQGDRRSAQRQVGNAVPSAIAELLGLEIRRQFFGERVRRTLRLLPTRRV